MSMRMFPKDFFEDTYIHYDHLDLGDNKNSVPQRLTSIDISIGHVDCSSPTAWNTLVSTNIFLELQNSFKGEAISLRKEISPRWRLGMVSNYLLASGKRTFLMLGKFVNFSIIFLVGNLPDAGNVLEGFRNVYEIKLPVFLE